MRIVNWIPISFIFISSSCTAVLTWHPLGQEECESIQCDSPHSRFCSYSYGIKFDTARNRFVNVSCIEANFTDFQPYTASEIVDNLSNNAVLAFMGDGTVRSLFISTLFFLGDEYSEWLKAIESLSSSWHETRFERAYLCSPPLGPKNLTIAFLWRPLLGAQMMSRIPWVKPSGKNWKCVYWENGQAMQHCDSSSTEGAAVRWQCGNALDSVQLPNSPWRDFIVISTAGHASASKELGKVPGVTAVPETYLHPTQTAFLEALGSLEKTKNLWRISDQGGRNIFLMPLRVQRGPHIEITCEHYERLNRSICSNAGSHLSQMAINHILEEFVRKPLRLRTNLTCGGDFEVIETDAVTGTQGGGWEPGTIGDGIHYTNVTNFVLLQLIADRIVNFNSSTWRSSSSWYQTSYLSNECGA